MTENKRFRLGYVCGDYGLIDNDEWIDLHSMSENSEKNVKLCINKMNELAEENEELKIFLKAVNEELSLANRDCDILEEENEQLKQRNEFLKKRCDEYWEEAGLNSDYYD